mmetsp:Transcript_39083/g.100120  ORF Transcript_39083/g.100120 Transcript_39083/m.100120 type:complete len:221 (-) Transcript_39083:395-1057(-)
MNSSRKSSIAMARALPSTTKQAPFFFLHWSIFVANSSLVRAVRVNTEHPFGNRRAEVAMHFAVSTLSPVNIHTFMPALRKTSSVCRTFVCSLSSTPVTPNMSMFTSIFANACSILFFLSCIALLARVKAVKNSSYSRVVIIFRAKTSVRSPSLAKLSASSLTMCFHCSDTTVSITLSAPFKKNTIFLVFLPLSMMPLLFLSGEKGTSRRMSYTSTLPSRC